MFCSSAGSSYSPPSSSFLVPRDDFSCASSFSASSPIALTVAGMEAVDPKRVMSELSAIVEHKPHFIEPLLAEKERLSIFPIQYPDIWDMYLKQVDCFWQPGEINLATDKSDFQTLTKDQQYFISQILAFFSQSDSIVMQNLMERFYQEIKIPEVRAFWGFQLAMENIHGHTYSMLITDLITDKSEREKLLNGIENYPWIAKKGNWAQKWIADKRSNFASRLVAFLCVEGIFFSGAFCAIFWLKYYLRVMPGLCFSNMLISRDEALHAEFAVLMYSKLQRKLTKKRIHEIVKEATELEHEFIIQALPCRLLGMNCDLMKQYIEFVADRICLQLGAPKLYGSKNPFDFMELISIESKANFFERTVSEYSLANTTRDENVFDFDNMEF